MEIVMWLTSDTARWALLIASPLLFVVQVYQSAAGWWLGLAAAGAGKRSFDDIVRVLAYVRGSAAPLFLVGALPDARALPSLAAWALMLALEALALRGRMGASTGQATGAALVMLLVWALSWLLIGAVVVLAIVAA